MAMAMANGDVKLLGIWASPYVNRVQLALNFKAVEFEFLVQDFSPNSELLFKSNPVYKKVPVLIHGDNAISESLIIVQYIDDNWTNGPLLLPSSPYDRAQARFWAAYIDEKWFPLLEQLRWIEGDHEDKKRLIKQAKEGATLLEEAFVKCSKGKEYFGGESIGYLDIALGSLIGWIKAVEIMHGVKFFDESRTPGLVPWVDRYVCNDVVKDILPEPQRLIEFFKTVLLPMMAARKAAAAATANTTST